MPTSNSKTLSHNAISPNTSSSRRSRLVALTLCLSLLLGLTAARNQTISVSNTLSVALGNVTLENQSEQKTVNVTGYGTFSTDMNAEPSQVTIQGQTLVRPNQGPILINGIDTALVKWHTGYIQVIRGEQL